MEQLSHVNMAYQQLSEWKMLTKLIKDGQRIRVHGTEGYIENIVIAEYVQI